VIPSFLNTLVNSSAASGGEEGSGGNPFDRLFPHVVPQESFHGIQLPKLFGMQVWDTQIFQLLSIVAMIVCFAGVRKGIVNNGSGRF